MKFSKYFLFIIAISISCNVLKSKNPGLPNFENKPNHTEYPLASILSNYPFNKAIRIQVVSFNLTLKKMDWNPNNSKLPSNGDTICFEQLDQLKFLSFTEVDSLTNIMFNTCHKYRLTTISQDCCYYPRNAIIFYDERGKAFEYVEMCIECQIIKFRSPNVQWLKPYELCDEMWENLKRYLNKIEISTN